MNQTSMMEQFQSYLSQEGIISIYGESGMGKTTLALQIVSEFMIKHKPQNRQCIWVQASETFPKKRLQTMYINEREKITYLLKNIFLVPGKKPFLKNFETLVLPPNLRFIVIDNISHHLRFAQANISLFQDKMKLMNEFFNHQLFPLIMFCLREKIILFLIHEVSFNPQSGQLKSYNNKLFERVRCVEINLLKSVGSQLKSMVLSTRNIKKQYTYEISEKGLIWL
jgi:ABC-type dipeptide/oligopeptide/nickel transport system ATPase component